MRVAVCSATGPVIGAVLMMSLPWAARPAGRPILEVPENIGPESGPLVGIWANASMPAGCNRLGHRRRARPGARTDPPQTGRSDLRRREQVALHGGAGRAQKARLRSDVLCQR